MKTISKITIGLAAAALFILSACNSGPIITEESLGLRKTDLYTETTTTGDKTQYSSSVAGTSQKFPRAFQDAPPMIPHDTTGMLPIQINNNQCTGCHMPEVAPAMGATPIPASHFTNFRPKHNFDGKKFTKSIDNMKNEVSIKETAQLQGARFNCSQCHAPQSEGALVVENNFEAVYTNADGASKSTWSGSAYLDELDTIKGDAGKVTADDIANADSKAGSLDH